MPTKADGLRYERWKIIETQRRWALKLLENPIVTIPLEDRVMQETTSLVDAFWHKVGCECGPCEGPWAAKAKELRLSLNPVPPATKWLGSPLPPLPDQAALRLQVYEAEARLTEDAQTLLPEAQAEQPFDPEGSSSE